MNLEAQHGKSIQVEVEIEIEVDMERVLQEQAAGGEGPPRSDPRLLGDAAELDGKRAVKGLSTKRPRVAGGCRRA